MRSIVRAIIYMRELRADCRCHEIAERRGYEVIGVVWDPAGSKYRGLVEACMAGAAEIILVCSRDDVPADRIPRLESVTQDLPPLPGEETLRLPSTRRRERFRRPAPRHLGVVVWALQLVLALFH